MNVPPIIPTKPAGAATAPATAMTTDAGTGGDDFAAMIAIMAGDGRPVETTDGSQGEIPFDPAVATTAQYADPADSNDPPPGDVIQSLIAGSKPQSKEASPFGSELPLVGNVEAVPTAPKSPEAAVGDDAANPALAGEQAVSASPSAVVIARIGPAESAASGGSETPVTPTGSGSPPISLAGVVSEFTNPAQHQPANAVLARRANGGATAMAGAQVIGAQVIGAPVIDAPVIDAGAPPNLHPAALPDAPVAGREVAATDLGLGAPGLEPRTAAPAPGGPSKPNAATGPANATAVGNTPASATDASGVVAGNVDGSGANPEIARSGAASPAAGATSDGAAAKTLPVPSGPGADPAAGQSGAPQPGAAQSGATQSGIVNDMAAAFGGDLRLGADSMRPAAVEQAFRAQALQPASEQVAVQISRAVQQNADHITIHLKPAALGRISIDLEIGPDNRLIAVIAADRPETLDLLQRDARALERALGDAGLKTDSGSLSFNLRGDGGGDGASGENRDDDADWSSYAVPQTAGDTTPMPVYARAPSPGGGIDIRV